MVVAPIRKDKKHQLSPSESVEAEETWDSQQAVIKKAFDSDKETVIIRSDTGVGKDYAKASHILDTDAGAERFIEMTTRITLAEEKLEDINKRDYGRKIGAYRWKSHFPRMG